MTSLQHGLHVAGESLGMYQGEGDIDPKLPRVTL